MRAGEEILWDIDEHATLFIEPSSAQAGAGRITLVVAGLDTLLERLAAQRIAHEPIETYSNGVRRVKVSDPDGNAIAFAELPGRRERVTANRPGPRLRHGRPVAPGVRRRTPSGAHAAGDAVAALNDNDGRAGASRSLRLAR